MKMTNKELKRVQDGRAALARRIEKTRPELKRLERKIEKWISFIERQERRLYLGMDSPFLASDLELKECLEVARDNIGECRLNLDERIADLLAPIVDA